VARYLLEVAVSEGVSYVAVLRHEDVAVAIGTVREVAARTLAAFRAEGLIRRADGRIELTNIEVLRSIAQADEFADFRIRP
jgi:CRP-like cAMP-binding protein